jgi:hypothetical protein
VLNRAPAPAELDRALSGGVSLPSLARVLLNSNEFLYVE